MKKIIVVSIFSFFSFRSHSQFPIAAIIQAGVKKVIIAVDLKIQKLQNKTLWLMNAQKVIENQMSKLKLSEIGDWSQKQLNIYRDYFDELKKVKTAITSWYRVREMLATQAAMIKEYKEAWTVFRSDPNFTSEDRSFMFNVYEGMMKESGKNLEQLNMVINSFITQMTDARRMEIINEVAAKIDQTFLDLKAFNTHIKTMSLQRSYEKGEIEYSKKLYGL